MAKKTAHLGLIATALLCLLLVPCFAAAPIAGTTIINRAEISYQDSVTGSYSRLESNTVRVTVAPLEGLTLADDRTAKRDPASQAYFPHRLMNTGNVTTTYKITFSNLGGDDFDLDDLRLGQDINDSGVIDPGEPLISSGGSVTLEPGTWVDLVLSGAVPASTTLGRVARVSIVAVSSTQGITAQNTDTVTTSGGPSIGLSLRASNMTPSVGDDETFTITGVNTGTAPAGPIDVTIDGSTVHLANSTSAPARYAIVRDVIPANTTFVAITEVGGSVPLYHLIGTATHAYLSAPPSDLTKVDAVAYAYPTIFMNQSFTLSFKVKINLGASGTITDIASVAADNSGSPLAVISNEVLLQLPVRVPVLNYYANDSFQNIAVQTLVASPLYLQASAAACNLDPLTAETHPIRIVSQKLGDDENFLATETGPNTGIFRITPVVPTHDGGTSGRVAGNKIVETTYGDVLIATLDGCGAERVSATIVVNPLGVVFDSSTNQVLAGAQVELIDVSGQGNGGNAGAPAKVLNPDGSAASSSVTTSADGVFQFPVVQDSTYRIKVTPPNGFKFASAKLPTLLPADRNVDVKASYGLDFPVNATTGPIHFDIPLDATAASGLFVQKEALRTYVEIGEFLDYQVKVKNSSGLAMSDVVVYDTLPAGFAYQQGTARLNKAASNDPDGGKGPGLAFHIGSLAAGSETSLTYRVKVGASAGSGDLMNRAFAKSGRATSNTATAAVKLLQNGAFSDKGYVVGNVFADCNGNHLRDSGDTGIPGVRVYLEDGTFAITDADGAYSIYGVQPSTHIAKVDASTLPAGVTFEVLSNRQAMRGSSRFVDMQNGGMEKADFALAGCSSELSDQLLSRKIKSDNRRQETDVALQQKTQVDPIQRSAADLKSAPASGVVVDGMLPGTASGAASVKPDLNQRTSKLEQAKAVVTSLVTGEVAASKPEVKSVKSDVPASTAPIPADLNNALGFVGISDGAVLPATQANVRVKGRIGSLYRLKVNGQDVPDTRIGSKTTISDRQIELWDFVGIGLKPGQNEIAVTVTDPFGNVRDSAKVNVIAPDKLAVLKLIAPDHLDAVDEPAPVKIRLILTDEKGVPVTSRTPVTLEASAGEWRIDDLDPKEPGTQIFVEGGKAELSFRPPAEVGSIKLRASSGSISHDAKIDMIPALRPMIAAGVVDLKLDLRSMDSGRLNPTQGNDGFERELKSLSAESADGKLAFGTHAGLMMKGKIRGDYLMTAAFDSDKSSHDQLFRDIQPDEFYPVYGDGSVRGYEAQSSGKAYLRLDKGKNYYMFGDFTTGGEHNLFLSGYSRSFNGFKQHYENGRVNFTGWGSHDTLQQLVEEMPGNGTSGPYLVHNPNAVVNSEKVEILTRDRNQPSLILHVDSQTRFTDYAFESYTGRLLFKSPVPTLDAFLNPVFIRVTYEVDGGGERFWVSGVDGRVKVTDRLELGATFVDDEKPGDEFRMMGFNSTIKFAPKTQLVAEFAQTDRALIGTGIGYRMEFQHESGRMQARFFTGQTNTSFDNPTALMSKGRGESGGKFTFKLDPRTRILGEALYSVDESTDGSRMGLQMGVERSLAHNMQLMVGYVHAQETTTPAMSSSVGATPNQLDSVQAKFTAPMPRVPRASITAEYQQDLSSLEKQMLAVGGRYQLSERTRAYVRHEFISSFGGIFALNTSQSQNVTVVGLESDNIRSAHLFSEYRARDAINGREAEASIGLRNTWAVANGIRVNSSIESVRGVEGASTNNSLALTGGVEFTGSDVWKGSARMEWRNATTNNSYLNTVGLAAKLSNDWTLLGRNIMASTISTGAGGDRVQDRAQIGVAYRDRSSNRWNGMALLEYKIENDSTNPELAYDRRVGILSAHVSYQPARDLLLAAHYAGKVVFDDSSNLSSKATTHLTSLRATYDLTKRVDVGVAANTLFTGWNSMQYGLGGEVGYLVAPNLWLSSGYNVTGFRDRDLGAEDYTKRGAYLRLRFKFDEGIFDKGLLKKIAGR